MLGCLPVLPVNVLAIRRRPVQQESTSPGLTGILVLQPHNLFSQLTVLNLEVLVSSLTSRFIIQISTREIKQNIDNKNIVLVTGRGRDNQIINIGFLVELQH